MFTKTETKVFISAVLHRIFLPDAVSKATFLTLAAGVGVVSFPTPFKVVLWNWLIETFALNLNEVTLATMSSGAADYWMGLILILGALTYNLVARGIQLKSEAKIAEKEKATIDADRKLFSAFLQVIPTNSPSVKFLKEHDLANTFDLARLRDFDNFTSGWDEPEKRFLREKIESKRVALHKKGQEFQYFLAVKTGPTARMRQSVVPDHLRDEWNLPKNYQDDIREGNRLASEFATLHEEFILTAKQELLC